MLFSLRNSDWPKKSGHFPKMGVKTSCHQLCWPSYLRVLFTNSTPFPLNTPGGHRSISYIINIEYENNSFDKITTSKINFNWTEIFDGSIPFKSVITRAEIIMSIWGISYRQAGPNHLWIDKHVVFGRPILIYDSLEKYLWNRPRTFLYALAKHLTKKMEGGDISALWRRISHNAKMTRW